MSGIGKLRHKGRIERQYQRLVSSMTDNAVAQDVRKVLRASAQEARNAQAISEEIFGDFGEEGVRRVLLALRDEIRAGRVRKVGERYAWAGAVPLAEGGAPTTKPTKLPFVATLSLCVQCVIPNGDEAIPKNGVIGPTFTVQIKGDEDELDAKVLVAFRKAQVAALRRMKDRLVAQQRAERAAQRSDG